MAATRITSFNLRVSGYKSLRAPVRAEIKPLTLISGTNSSGKSSFTQSLLLLKQTLEVQFDPGPLLLNGPNVALTSAAQMFSRGKSSKDVADKMTFGVVLQGIDLRLTFGRARSKALRLQAMEVSSRNKSVLLHEATRGNRAFLDEIPGFPKEFPARLFPEGDLEVVTRRNRSFFDIALKYEGVGEASVPYQPTARIRRMVLDIIHVPGLRGNPERVYPSSAVGSAFPGSFEKYVASLINDWQTSSRDGMDHLRELNQDLEDLGLTWKITARPVSDTSVELLVGRLPRAQQGGAHDVVNIADVGFGVSQTLPVLTALIAARPGQIVYLEQPEIHLHPRAQTALANILAKHARRGVIIIAETHSSLLIKGVQTCIAKQQISAGKVALHWFERSATTGETSITTAELDSLGRFGDWPLDFDEISMNAEINYLNAVEARISGEE